MIVAFLDLENYFNSIGLECLFEILEKFGMAKEDVGILKQYYEHTYFQVAQESREATARIRLHQMTGKQRRRVQTQLRGRVQVQARC
jgi:hypothetical protein